MPCCIGGMGTRYHQQMMAPQLNRLCLAVAHVLQAGSAGHS